jgi:hypothetical protein
MRRAEGLEGALSATAEQSELHTPFDWGDQACTMQEEQVLLWAEDADIDQEVTIPVGAARGCGEKRALSEVEEEYYYCRREATQRPPPWPIADCAIVDQAPEAAPAVPVRVYLSGQRMWGSAAALKRARCAPNFSSRRRCPSRCAWRCRWARMRRWRAASWCTGWRGPRRRSGGASSKWRRASCGPGPADAIEEAINDLIPADAQLLSFGGGADDDLNLRSTGKGVARHAGLVMDSWIRWTACARRRMQRRRWSAGCWCAGPSACSAACSDVQSSTPTSTRGRRASRQSCCNGGGADVEALSMGLRNCPCSPTPAVRRRRRARLRRSQRPGAAAVDQHMSFSVQQKQVSHQIHKSAQRNEIWNQ